MPLSHSPTDGGVKSSPRAPLLVLLALLVAITAMGAFANQIGRSDLADPAAMIER